MAMNVGSAGSSDDPELMVDMNTTPLIDVMLVLLIMLIITIPIQTHAVKLTMPAGNPPPTTLPVVVNVEVDFDGTVFWNGQPLADRQTFEARLADVAAQSVQAEVHVKASKLAAYKSVAAVLASAQRLGVTKLGVVGAEQLF
jgi:biopolymer transport protein ExbD